MPRGFLSHPRGYQRSNKSFIYSCLCWRRGWDSDLWVVLILKNLADLAILWIRQIRSNAWVETRIEHMAPAVEELQKLNSDKDFFFWLGNSNPERRRRELAANILSDVRRLNGRKKPAGELGITALIGSSIG